MGRQEHTIGSPSHTRVPNLNGKMDKQMDKASYCAAIKQDQIHGNPVADGWAGAVMQKPLAI